jgi:hypothetical protein
VASDSYFFSMSVNAELICVASLMQRSHLLIRWYLYFRHAWLPMHKYPTNLLSRNPFEAVVPTAFKRSWPTPQMIKFDVNLYLQTCILNNMSIYDDVHVLYMIDDRYGQWSHQLINVLRL